MGGTIWGWGVGSLATSATAFSFDYGVCLFAKLHKPAKNRPLPSFGNRVTIRGRVGRRAPDGSLRTIKDRAMSFCGDAITYEWMLTNLTQIL
jgi:hypothetical protein